MRILEDRMMEEEPQMKTDNQGLHQYGETQTHTPQGEKDEDAAAAVVGNKYGNRLHEISSTPSKTKLKLTYQRHAKQRSLKILQKCPRCHMHIRFVLFRLRGQHVLC